MDITPMTIYWITRLDIVCIIANILAVFSAALMILTIVAYTLFQPEEDKAADVLRKFSPITITISAISWLAVVFVPTTKELAAIYIVPTIANNEKVQDIGNRLYDLSAEWLEELKPQKKEIAK